MYRIDKAQCVKIQRKLPDKQSINRAFDHPAAARVAAAAPANRGRDAGYFAHPTASRMGRLWPIRHGWNFYDLFTGVIAFLFLNVA